VDGERRGLLVVLRERVLPPRVEGGSSGSGLRLSGEESRVAEVGRSRRVGVRLGRRLVRVVRLHVERRPLLLSGDGSEEVGGEGVRSVVGGGERDGLRSDAVSSLLLLKLLELLLLGLPLLVPKVGEELLGRPRGDLLGVLGRGTVVLDVVGLG